MFLLSRRLDNLELLFLGLIQELNGHCTAPLQSVIGSARYLIMFALISLMCDSQKWFAWRRSSRNLTLSDTVIGVVSNKSLFLNKTSNGDLWGKSISWGCSEESD